MKKYITTITVLLCGVMVFGQNEWLITGNTGLNEVNNFIGTTNQVALRFRTDNAFRMGLDGTTGFLGLNTTTPQMRFHVQNGGILSTGTIGTNPDLGAGTRLMWIPDVGAIRAGFAIGSEWDSAFVGENSAAFGSQNTAAGENSFAAGRNNNVTTLSAAAFGSNNTFADAMAAGRQGIDAFSAGRANYNEGDAGIALGLNNFVLHQAGVALGQSCTVGGLASLAQGFQSESLGWNSIAMGYQAIANEDNSIMLGAGVNDIEDSFKVGFGSTGDVLFAGPGGAGGGVGISGIVTPTESLDVDGTARLRQMPNNTPDVLITGVEADDTGDYVLNYSTLEDLGVQCDWEVVNVDDVATGFPGACREGQVLVGTDNQTGSNAKVFMTKDYAGITLNVEATNGSGLSQIAGRFVAEGSPGLLATGVNGIARNAGLNYGVIGTAQKGVLCTGVYGNSTGAELINFGVFGLAEGTVESVPVNNVGVYGRARGPSSTYNFGGYFLACDADRQNFGIYAETCDPSGIAGYFVGTVQENQYPITLSDQNIKTGFEEINDALTLIADLNPVKYGYLTEQFPHLYLPSHQSYGFKAQEVQQVLPTLVGGFYHPAKHDTTGVEISPSEELLGIRYQEFIPILTAGIKDQQSQIAEQEEKIVGLEAACAAQEAFMMQMHEQMQMMNEQMQMLQQQIDGCCMNQGWVPKSSEMGEQDPIGKNELYQNTPNPFRNHTTIRYTLEQGGRVMLKIHDGNGREVAQLENAEQSAGTYTYVWDAAGLPAGLYHYTLFVDDELLVKRAIKLND